MIIKSSISNSKKNNQGETMKKLTWGNGLKIDTTLDRNLNEALERIRNKKASLIVVDGGVGEGKTTLGVILAKRLSEKNGHDFSIPDQVKQGGKDFLEGMDWCVKNGRKVIVYDEAGDFNTRASLTYFNQNMNRVFETYRALGIIVILCLPGFKDIDTSLMNKMIARFLIHCYDRNNNYGNYKVYSLWRMWYIKDKMKKVTVPSDAFRMVSPNFYGRFRDLDPEDSKILEDHSMEGKKNIIQKGMLASKGLITIREIGSKTGYSDASVRIFVNKRKLKFEKHGSTNYFSKDVVEMILRAKENNGSIS
jgi:hypothetical protein